MGLLNWIEQKFLEPVPAPAKRPPPAPAAKRPPPPPAKPPPPGVALVDMQLRPTSVEHLPAHLWEPDILVTQTAMSGLNWKHRNRFDCDMVPVDKIRNLRGFAMTARILVLVTDPPSFPRQAWNRVREIESILSAGGGELRVECVVNGR